MGLPSRVPLSANFTIPLIPPQAAGMAVGSCFYPQRPGDATAVVALVIASLERDLLLSL